MPTIPYGYNEHALDFPGTIHVTYQHFIEYCLDVCKSVAHAGFDRIVIIDGHGSNEHLCEFIARRATLETSALVASTMWTNMAIEAFESVRESGFGGAAHACELETSAYLYLAEERVQMDKAMDHDGGAAGRPDSDFLRVDLTKGWGTNEARQLDQQRDPSRSERHAYSFHPGQGQGRDRRCSGKIWLRSFVNSARCKKGNASIIEQCSRQCLYCQISIRRLLAAACSQ